MLDWTLLLNGLRLKEKHGSQESTGTAAGRKELERDYDRILFATPTRRLADKTQVYPMEENDSVRTRLTHSHEVSNLARSIGVRLAFSHADEVFGPEHESLEVKRCVPALLAAVGLAHDLGNPPFGHQGEVAMQQWFAALKERPDIGELPEDFLAFDGNAQTFRLLTRLQVLNDQYGLNLTVATLAALIKYPSVYGLNNKYGFKKYGIFASEKSIIEDVWQETGLSYGLRHPLAYVMEACDDIAYSVIDAEDTIKKGYASFYDLMDYLESNSDGDAVIASVVKNSRNKNEDFKKEDLSSRELNDLSTQMFRVYAITEMVQAATTVFVENIKRMLSGKLPGGFELIKESKAGNLCSVIKKFDFRFGFQHRDVLRLELTGSNYIKSLMDTLWAAVCNGKSPDKPFERYVYGEISENYRRIFEKTDRGIYARCQLVCDAVSGMTESYLIKKHDEFKALNGRADAR